MDKTHNFFLKIRIYEHCPSFDMIVSFQPDLRILRASSVDRISTCGMSILKIRAIKHEINAEMFIRALWMVSGGGERSGRHRTPTDGHKEDVWLRWKLRFLTTTPLPPPHFPQIGVQPGSGDNKVLLVGCGASSDGAMVGRRAEGDLPQRTFATLFYSMMIERKINRIFTENFPIMTNFSCRSSSCCFCLFATHLLASGHGIQLTGEPPWRPQRPGPYLSTDWWERDSWLCRKLPQSTWPRWTTRMLIWSLFLRKNTRQIGIQLTGEPPWRPPRPRPCPSTTWWERGSWLCRKLPQSTWPQWTTRMLISSLSLRKNTRQIGCEYFYKTHPAVFSLRSPKNSIDIYMHLPRRSPTPMNIYRKVGVFCFFC